MELIALKFSQAFDVKNNLQELKSLGFDKIVQKLETKVDFKMERLTNLQTNVTIDQINVFRELTRVIAMDKYRVQNPKFRRLVSRDNPHMPIFYILMDLPASYNKNKQLSYIRKFLRGEEQATCQFCGKFYYSARDVVLHQKQQKVKGSTNCITFTAKSVQAPQTCLSIDKSSYLCNFGCDIVESSCR